MPDRQRPVILLTGGSGQVGWELARTLSPLGQVLAYDRRTLDLENEKQLRAALRQAKPQVVVNAAAHTKVDLAESEEGSARLVNCIAPRVLAEEAQRAGAVMIHYSTDYVFDGAARSPYLESESPAPVNVYGRTKLEGDRAVLESGATVYIFRVGWVYGLRGQNFLRTIQRLAAERDELRIVGDQYGTPTWARLIAETTTLALSQVMAAAHNEYAPPPPGLYHMASPDSTTWYEFAAAILARSLSVGGRQRPAVISITTAEFPTLARRPPWSVLNPTRLADAFGLTLPPWREQLRLCLESAAEQSTRGRARERPPA